MTHYTRTVGVVSSSRVTLFAATILSVVGAFYWLFGTTPWVLVFAAGLAIWLAFAQRTSFTQGVPATLMVLLASYTLVVRVTPFLGMTLAFWGGVSLIISIFGALLYLFRFPRLRLPSSGFAVCASACYLLALLIGTLYVPVRTRHGSGPSWAMWGDAVNNIVIARFMIHDGGLNSFTNPQSSPLTSALIALSAAVGRSRVEPDDLLRHDVVAASSLWLLMILTVAVLAALVGWRMSLGGRSWIRIIGSLGLAVFTTSWYFLGVAFEFGFYNSTLGLIGLLSAWLAWLTVRNNPRISLATLIAAAIMMLATWAPLAVIPIGLAALVLVWFAPWLPIFSYRFRSDRVGQPLGWATWLLFALPVPAYFLIFSLPDLRRQGYALASPGAIIALPQRHVALVIFFVVATALIYAAANNRWYEFIGLTTVLAFSALGLGFLMYQRISAGESRWGYFPIKMAWTLLCLLLVIAVSYIGSVIANPGRRWAQALVLTLVTGWVISSLMNQVSPPWFWGRTWPLADIATNSNNSSRPYLANQVFDLADPNEHTLVARLGDQRADWLANFWLILQHTQTFREPIRQFSQLDATDVATVCQAMDTWDVRVRVVTADPQFVTELDSQCGDLDFFVDLVSIPATP